MNIIAGVMKAMGFISCFLVGYYVKEWDIAGQPEAGWVLWQPFVFIVFSVCWFYLSRTAKKKVKKNKE